MSLVERRGCGVLVLCGPTERDHRPRDRPPRGPTARRFASPITPLSLGLTKACVRRLDLLVTTDSGPRHFAAAFDRPVVTLFGPTHIDWTETYFPKGDPPAEAGPVRPVPAARLPARPPLHARTDRRGGVRRGRRPARPVPDPEAAPCRLRRSPTRLADGWSPLGMPSLRELLELPGVVVSGHVGRNVSRVVLGDETAYIKREHRVRWRDRIRSLLDGFGPVSISEREYRVIRRLREHGLPAPQLLARGEVDDRAFLLLAEVDGALELRRSSAG